jgi:peptide/nickel transport system substrate-binding protein
LRTATRLQRDFTSLTVPLRQGVAWSDGEPFTAADVVFTVETLIKYQGFNAHSFFVITSNL